jgi:ABC-type dipeptide/oligopeptide/nickel transport system permease subunit
LWYQAGFAASICLYVRGQTLSFLGLGIQPPTPSWGNVLCDAFENRYRGPWLVLGRGTASFVSGLCIGRTCSKIRVSEEMSGVEGQ